MNNNHIQQIFAHYIDRFEELNNEEHGEYYKWQIAKRFHKEMDDALSSSDAELPAKLYELKKLSANLIDSYTQPFHHGKYGDGTVKSNCGTSVVVDFPEVGEKQFGTVIATVNGIIKPDVAGYAEKIETYKDVLKKEGTIMSSLSFAEKEFAPYSEYLG